MKTYCCDAAYFLLPCKCGLKRKEKVILYLYKISQTEREGYDTYDSAVVVAESEDAARAIHPAGYHDAKQAWKTDSWASVPAVVNAVCIGIALEGFKSGDIICASFNAG